MAKPSKLVRKKITVEAPQVKLLVQRLGARSVSEAIRIVIDDFLFNNDSGDMQSWKKRLPRGRSAFRVQGVGRRDHRTS